MLTPKVCEKNNKLSLACQANSFEFLGNGREKVSPYWFMEEMERRKLRIGGKDGKPK